MNERDVTDFYGEMWGYVQGAIDEIPDVIASLGLEPKALLVEAKTFFEARFAAAGLAVTA